MPIDFQPDSSIDFQPEEPQKPAYDPSFMGTMGREASAGWEDVKAGMKDAFTPSSMGVRPGGNIGGLVKAGLGALQWAGSPIMGAGAVGGEMVGEGVRSVTQPFMGELGSSIAGTGAGATTNAAIQLLMAPFLAGKLAKGASSLASGARRSLGEFVAPGTTRQAGVEAAMEMLGAVPNTINRIFAPKASKAAYTFAESRGPLQVRPLVDVLEDVARNAGKSVPNRPAIRAIGETNKNLLPPITVPEVPAAANMADFLASKKQAAGNLLAQLKARPSEVSYRDAINEVHGLRTQASMAFSRDNNTAGTTLNEAAKALIDKMDELSPAIKKANALYKREKSIEAIESVLSKPGPGEKFEELLKNDPLIFSAISYKEAKEIEAFAAQIGRIGATGAPYNNVAPRIVNFLTNRIAHGYDTDAARARLSATFLKKEFNPSRSVAATGAGIGLGNINRFDEKE